METLAIAIRQNQEIRRISIDNEETKILQYADDTTAVLSDISSAEQKRWVCGLGRPKKIKQNLLESNDLMSR